MYYYKAVVWQPLAMKVIKSCCRKWNNAIWKPVKALIPVTQQSSVLSWVKQRCNEIEDICNGVFLLGELSARTKDRIVSFGELLSSKIIAPI
jgi:aspartokinase